MPKYDEIFCFCVTRPPIDAILGRVLEEQRYLVGIEGPLDDGTRRITWKRDAPAIEVWEASGDVARRRIETAREALDEVARSNPNAWYVAWGAVKDLRKQLKDVSRLVGFRSPDVGKGWRGPFRISRSLARKIRFDAGGVVMLGERVFETRGGKVVGR